MRRTWIWPGEFKRYCGGRHSMDCLLIMVKVVELVLFTLPRVEASVEGR